MIEIKNLDILIGTRYLVKSLSLVLNKGDKLAIIGEEGNGKSTLIKAILGICEYAKVTGYINFNRNKIGYLEQSISDVDLEKKVYDYLFVDDNDYYDKLKEFYKYLEILNLNDEILKQEMHDLSGGEKVKTNLLKILLNEVDVLFLDEPTNDLDIETLEWLEKFINNINKPIMYVSHDETLLANTANMILHLEQLKKKTECKHTLLRIDYNTYVNERLRAIEKQTQIATSERFEFRKKQEKLQRIMQKVEYQQETITRANPHGGKVLKKKMHSLKSQEKKLNEMELTEFPDVEESINFRFEDVFIPKTKVILKLNIPELKIENKILAYNLKIDIIGNEHVCIIGKNGVGKTTLLKIIYEDLKKRNDLKVGYMPQNYDDIFKDYDNVLDFITDSKSKDEVTKARMYLGNMNFTRDEMTGKITDLSNGTKAKLFLMKCVLDECNVLILDEPTRNMSPLSNPVVRRVLKDFKGTIISVSHDRKYIEEVVTSLYLLTQDGLTKIDNIYKTQG